MKHDEAMEKILIRAPIPRMVESPHRERLKREFLHKMETKTAQTQKWSLIMKNRWARIAAAAAAVVVAVLVLLQFQSTMPSSIAWADVNEQFENDLTKYSAVYMENKTYKDGSLHDTKAIWIRWPWDRKWVIGNVEEIEAGGEKLRIDHDRMTYYKRALTDDDVIVTSEIMEFIFKKGSPLFAVPDVPHFKIKDGIFDVVEIINGEKTTKYVFDLTPRYSVEAEAFVWFSNSDRRFVRAELHRIDAESKREFSSVYYPVIYGPEIPEGTFSVVIPEGYSDIANEHMRINNLGKIGLGIQMYAHSHQNAMPKDLSELVPNYLPDEKMILSLINEEPLHYAPAKSIADNPFRIVAWDPAEDEDGKCAALYIEGYAKTLTSQELAAELKRCGIEP